MKYLGIDYGDKRVGVAVSDETGRLAFPYKVLENKGDLMEEILEIIAKENIGGVVVGESLDSDGLPNIIQKDIDEFCANLKTKSNLPVSMEQEFWTSVQASRGINSRRPDNKNYQASGSLILMNQNRDMHDASAAAIILQSFLDRKKDVI